MWLLWLYAVLVAAACGVWTGPGRRRLPVDVGMTMMAMVMAMVMTDLVRLVW